MLRTVGVCRIGAVGCGRPNCAVKTLRAAAAARAAADGSWRLAARTSVPSTMNTSHVDDVVLLDPFCAGQFDDQCPPGVDV
jgi:hypothetical protein